MNRRAALLLLVLILAACASGAHNNAAIPGEASRGPTQTLVTFGGSATEGDGVRDRLRDAWPYLVFDAALPQGTVLVNAALDGATVKNAIAAQLPVANETHPHIAAVWLGADDLVAHTPIPHFKAALVQFIGALKRLGVRRILVANLPKSYGPGARPYNDAIEQVVYANAVEPVDLSALDIPLRPVDGLPPQPDATGHRLVANAFEQALRAQP